MVSFLQSLLFAVSFLRIPFTIIGACVEAGRRNKPSIVGPPANGNKSNAKKSRFRPNRNSTGTTYHWSVILRSFSVVSNSAKRDANGFFKVLWLSSNLLISRHPVHKSKFGACAVTGYCSFTYAKNPRLPALIDNQIEYSWNNSLISLVTIWLHIFIF